MIIKLRNIFYIVILIAIALAASVFYWKGDIANTQHDDLPNETVLNKSNNVSGYRKEVTVSDERKDQRTSADPSLLSEHSQKLLAIATSVSKNIDFYGRVVDQNNTPVVGAKIPYRINTLLNVNEVVSDVALTDSNGVFNIKGNGFRLNIGMPVNGTISNVYLPPANQISDVRKELSFRADGRDEASNWVAYTNKNPYIFNVWRATKFEKIISNSGVYGLYELKADGTIYTLTQAGGSKRRNITFAQGDINDGYVQFSCERNKDGNNNPNKKWSATIKPVNGGIQRTSDFYLNEAPLNEYVSFLVENYDINSEILHEQRYYFYSNNKKQFGSLKVMYDPFASKSHCNFVIEYKINPNGSRNLAVKSEPDY